MKLPWAQCRVLCATENSIFRFFIWKSKVKPSKLFKSKVHHGGSVFEKVKNECFKRLKLLLLFFESFHASLSLQKCLSQKFVNGIFLVENGFEIFWSQPIVLSISK